MKKLLVLLISIMSSMFTYSQHHYYAQDYGQVYGHGTSFDYVFDCEYYVYYNEDYRDYTSSFEFVCNQFATISINDTLGFYSLVFKHDSIYEVYEFEYDGILWEDSVMWLVSKDFIGLKTAALGIEEENGHTRLYLLWFDEPGYSVSLYYAEVLR